LETDLETAPSRADAAAHILLTHVKRIPEMAHQKIRDLAAATQNRLATAASQGEEGLLDCKEAGVVPHVFVPAGALSAILQFDCEKVAADSPWKAKGRTCHVQLENRPVDGFKPRWVTSSAVVAGSDTPTDTEPVQPMRMPDPRHSEYFDAPLPSWFREGMVK
jgi:hypothetical protein